MNSAVLAEELRCRILVLHTDFVLRYHHVHDTSLMPGVVFAELVQRVLLARGVDTARLQLRDLLFHQAIATADGLDREVVITIKGEQVSAESRAVRSGAPEGPWQPNLSARLVAAAAPPT
ncbi:MAG TPA: polyketide synthase dehydratase domain-containing protein, partial [Kofleriaceae bacterium]|nr:polyketide synthase dehydratase domain-containing protein [Kofleriaceae bacterium]